MNSLPLLRLLVGALVCGGAAGLVRGAHPLNFENDIVPILSKFGCNTAGCHGKAEGQNGFKLSVFGFDPLADHRALTMEGRGRRVFPAAPEQSLLLRKASGGLPHGGGIRIDRARPEFETLRAWIAAGVPFGSPDDPRVVAIELTPHEAQLAMRGTQRLQVMATWSDGQKQDVTQLATFQSNHEGLATVDAGGLVTVGEAAGDVAIMASYLGHVDVCRAMVPQAASDEPFPTLDDSRVIDRLVHAKLRKLNIQPSSPCDDATFLRRVYLDVIGTQPTAEEARRFLADTALDKRTRLVDELLQRPEYADFWALQWADLLRVDRLQLGRKQAYLYYRWIHDGFAANKPLDQFARELVAAEGPLNESPAGHFYKVVSQPGAMASTVSQVFLGTRIECAQCHHHPFDRWGQDDFFGMQAYFTQVTFKESQLGDVLVNDGIVKTTHPRTGAEILAHALDQPIPNASPAGNRRAALAAWLTAKDNPWFARSLANRYWAHFLGRGLVEPVDDFRLTNPPSNPELLDALAQELIQHNFNAHDLIRATTASQTYQRSAQPNESNSGDELNYSRFLFKRLSAEVLFDAVCQSTGVAEKFDGVPSGSRAIQLWDSDVKHYFLKLFGRPERATACECERVSEPTVSQVLHVLNSPAIHHKLDDAGGRISQLVAQHPSNDVLVDELYLNFFSRFPTPGEKHTAIAYLDRRVDRQQSAEDLAWTMLNSLEFVFNH